MRAVVIVRAMSRIPYVRREELGPEGQQLWDGIVSSMSDALASQPPERRGKNRS